MLFRSMGRGLVEPLDLHHSDNPASHPELLDLLAKELTAHKFDLKWFARELAGTQTYARSSVIPGDARNPPEALFSVAAERPLVAEQLARAFLAATGEQERVAAAKSADKVKAPDAEEEGESPRAKSRSLKDFEKAFLGAFANAAKEPELNVNPTLRAALFLRNNDLVLWALERRQGNLIDRLAAMTDAAKIADEIYLSILSRPPAPDEKSELAAYLAKHTADRDKALGRFAWAMLSSMEFFTNH